MNISTRAANQLYAVDPDDVAETLDTLRDREFKAGASIIEITSHDRAFRCFVARHRDGTLVLLSVVPARPRAP